MDVSTHPNFETGLPEVRAVNRFKNTAISYLFSDPRMACVELSEQEYMDGQIAYRSQQNEQALMLASLQEAVQHTLPTQDTYKILSIGCGSGLFEYPFLAALLAQGQSIDFVGIDPNEAECLKAKEWCQQLQADAQGRFNFSLQTIGFEDFQTEQTFDLILLIQVIFYFTDVEAVIRKANTMLTPSGMTSIAVSKRWMLNEPFAHVLHQRQGQPAWFTHELETALTQLNYPFRQEHLNFFVNITSCFQEDSPLGQHLLNFMVDIRVEALSPSQKQLLLDYFRASSQTMPGGDILLPHAGTLFYLEKVRGN